MMQKTLHLKQHVWKAVNPLFDWSWVGKMAGHDASDLMSWTLPDGLLYYAYIESRVATGYMTIEFGIRCPDEDWYYAAYRLTAQKNTALNSREIAVDEVYRRYQAALAKAAEHPDQWLQVYFPPPYKAATA